MSNLLDNQLLLGRDSFREGVLARDGYRCVICRAVEEDGVRLDAHHIMERRLWDNGGYFASNGATLCDRGLDGCHMKAEQTLLSCEEIRAAAGITKVLLPGHLYTDATYTKWGDIISPDGTRTKGELFNDGSVQKVLAAGGVLGLYHKYVKYPRTMHLPWSPGMSDDDRMLESTAVFEGREVIVTEKCDGECSSLYSDYYHTRSVESEQHESRGWLKRLQAEIGYNIPDEWRVCGENLFAQHSIAYDNLPSYFLVFSIWNENNVCLSWNDTVEYAGVLGLELVPLLYRGPWDEAMLRRMTAAIDTVKQEGLVVRLADAFPYGAFRKSVAKWVRKGHVITTHHWKSRMVVRNGLVKRAV